MYRIPLHVSSVDLDDQNVIKTIDAHLDDLEWAEVSGRILATIYTDHPDPIGLIIQAVRKIRNCLGVSVLEVDQDFVNISDIAHRIGFSREAVRNWVEGRRGPGSFPESAGSAGSGDRGAQRIWRWADVSAWLKAEYGLGDEEDHLSHQQLAAANAAIQRVPEVFDREWEVLGSVYENELMIERIDSPVPVKDTLPAHVTARIRLFFTAAKTNQLPRDLNIEISSPPGPGLYA